MLKGYDLLRNNNRFPVLLLLLSSTAIGGNFLHFVGEDIHNMFSSEPLAVIGLGGVAAAGTYMLEDNWSCGGFMGEGLLKGCSEVCDHAFGLPLLGFSTITWAGGALLNSPDGEETGQMLTEGLLLTYGMTGVLKIASSRTRPDCSNTRSFPSAHSSGTACAAVILWDCYGPQAGIPATVIAAFTALSRVNLEKHYPSDVIAGAAIGISIGLAVCAAHEADPGSGQQIQPVPGIKWSSTEGIGVYF